MDHHYPIRLLALFLSGLLSKEKFSQMVVFFKHVESSPPLGPHLRCIIERKLKHVHFTYHHYLCNNECLRSGLHKFAFLCYTKHNLPVMRHQVFFLFFFGGVVVKVKVKGTQSSLIKQPRPKKIHLPSWFPFQPTTLSFHFFFYFQKKKPISLMNGTRTMFPVTFSVPLKAKKNQI